MTGLAGFLLAKTAAAHLRRGPNDWYDIAYVLLHNDADGVDTAAVLAKFGGELASIRTALDDLRTTSPTPTAKTPSRTPTMVGNHPALTIGHC